MDQTSQPVSLGRVKTARRGCRAMGILAPCLLLLFQTGAALDVAVKVEEIDKIANGRNAFYPQVANLAVMLQGGRYGYFCSGTLVSPSWILTAWHCLDDKNGAMVIATVGRPDLRNTSAGEQVRAVSAVAAPDGSDLALLGLSRPITTVEPMARASWQDVPPPGALVEVAGFGPMNGRRRLTFLEGVKWQADMPGWWDRWWRRVRNRHGREQPEGAVIPDGGASQLQSLMLTVVSERRCEDSYYALNIERQSMVCAMDMTQNSAVCRGDSGGPLLLGGSRVVGVVTAGPDTGTCGVGAPIIFTLIGQNARWVEDTISMPPSTRRRRDPGLVSNKEASTSTDPQATPASGEGAMVIFAGGQDRHLRGSE